MCPATCPIPRLLEQNVGVWHAGAGQSCSSETLCYSLQTAGSGWAAHSVLTGRRHPNGEHGRDHHGMWTLMYKLQVISSLIVINQSAVNNVLLHLMSAIYTLDVRYTCLSCCQWVVAWLPATVVKITVKFRPTVFPNLGVKTRKRSHDKSVGSKDDYREHFKFFFIIVIIISFERTLDTFTFLGF